MKIGAASMNQTPLDWENNLKNIRAVLKEAKKEGIEILCLQELVVTSYACQDMFLANWVNEKALNAVEALLPDTSDLAVCIGIPFRYDDDLYNCMVFIHDQKVLGVSAKQNLPGDGVYYEPRWFKEWPSGLQTTIDLFGREVPFGDIIYQLKGLKIGFEICEDAWRKDRPACQAEYEGVDLILNPSASHYEFQKVAVREDLIRKSSEQFNCTYLFANQLGNEAGRLIYEGDMIIASKGKILNRADCFHFKTYNLIWSDLQFDGINQEQGPPATIPLNEEFTSVASLALFDYMRKSKSNGFKFL